MVIKLVIFDLWRTLLPTAIDFEYLVSLVKNGKIKREEFIPRYELAVERKVYSDFRELLIDFHREFNEEDNTLLNKELGEIFLKRFQKIEFYHDVIPNLKLLKKNGYKIALLSNTENFVKHHLEENLGAKYYFDYFAYSCDVGLLKPQKEFFIHVLEKFDVLPSEAIMIGDSLRSDIGGANNAKINSCWLNRDNKIVDFSKDVPDFTINSIDQVHKILENLNNNKLKNIKGEKK